MDSVNTDHVVHMEHHFDATASRLFDAWSNPAQLAEWGWGSLGRSPRAEVNFRVGGEFRVETTRPDGAVWSFSGTYIAIEPGARIAHTLVWDAPVGYGNVPEQLEALFIPDATGSTLELIHSGVPDQRSAEGHREGWQNMLETLALFLGRA